MRRAFVVAVLVTATAGIGRAQQKEPIGPWVADLRVVTAGLPSQEGWTPAVPSGTVVPSRGFGFEVGAHLHLIRRRAIALGVGGTWLVARGTSTPATVDGMSPTLPDVTTRITAMSPQISLNFGHSLGFSYISAGLGRSRAESEATLAGTALARESDWVKTLNYGGGARWFLNDHVGVGFDLRWHKVSLVPATSTHPGAPRASLLVAGAGIVVK
jgi:hypothetical protein